MTSPQDWIDLAAYPILEPDSARGRALVEHCREQLAANSPELRFLPLAERRSCEIEPLVDRRESDSKAPEPQ